MLTAGEKTERITVLRDAITRDTDGSEIRTPETLVTRWASVVPVSGREFWAAQTAQSRISYRLRLDYFEAVKQSDTVSWNGMTLQIVAVMHDRQAWETTLMCDAINA